MRNLESWFVWCGIGEPDGKHEVRKDMSKKEALITAKFMAETWPRVLVGQVNSRHPRGIIHGGIVCGRKSGVCEKI